MPRIAEIREIDGECWVRMEPKGDEGALTIWTAEEVRRHDNSIRCAERLRCVWALEAMKND